MLLDAGDVTGKHKRGLQKLISPVVVLFRIPATFFKTEFGNWKKDFRFDGLIDSCTGIRHTSFSILKQIRLAKRLHLRYNNSGISATTQDARHDGVVEGREGILNCTGVRRGM